MQLVPLEPGKLLFRDLVNILPMLDETCVLEMTGAQVRDALENACSQYPKLEVGLGTFHHVILQSGHE